MAHHRAKLTAAFCRTVALAGKYHDGQGLILRVTPSGSKQWIQRLTIQGRGRELGLGGYPLVTLAQARDAAFDNRRLARAGGDPMAAKRKEVPTLEQAAARVFEMHRPNWRNAHHTSEWMASLRRYVFPRLGEQRVDRVSTADIMAVLLPIWNTKQETARRVKQRIGAVMKWAIAQGHRQDNPAGEVLSAALPKQARVQRHHKALPHPEVASAIKKVRRSGASASTKLAFEFLVLTACRSGEVRLARWEEFCIEFGEWKIPAARMKANRDHRVPLSARAMEILSEAWEVAVTSDLVFPSPTGRVLSDATLSKLIRELGIQAVPHGFRSSFRDWAAECTNAPHAVMEAALAHTIKNKVEAAYARSDLLDRRRELMNDWARYLESGM